MFEIEFEWLCARLSQCREICAIKIYILSKKANLKEQGRSGHACYVNEEAEDVNNWP